MIRVLAALLVAQLALSVYLYWPADSGPVAAETLILGMDREALTEIDIDDGTASVTLSRNSDDRWLADSGLPIDEGRLATLLAALLASDPGYPIASSDSAAARFRVARSDYERRIELRGGNTAAAVYLGSSPGFRKVHARREGDSAIYVLELNSYDAPSSAESWLDRGLVALTDVRALTVNGARYRLEDNEWVGDAATLDTAQVSELVKVLAGLQVSGVTSSEDAELADSAEESLRLEAQLADGSTVNLLLRSAEDRYFLRSSAFEQRFDIGSYDAERLIDALAPAATEATSSAPGEELSE